MVQVEFIARTKGRKQSFYGSGRVNRYDAGQATELLWFM